MKSESLMSFVGRPGIGTFLLILALPHLGLSQTSTDSSGRQQTLAIHFQQTVVTQWHYSFHVPYEGLNSLSSSSESKMSVTSTLFLGVRLTPTTEVYLNPELSGGDGLSGTSGIAGFPNGETFRIGNPTPTLTPARMYIQQSIPLGDESESVSDEPNHLAGKSAVRRITLAAGKFSLADFFDDNTYSHDPRSQFLNWSLMDNGAWDYAADTRGYTWGMYAEEHESDWSSRIAATMVPKEANKLEMDTDISKAFSLNLELERKYTLESYDGVVRLLFYRNLAHMGNYREAVDEPQYQLDITRTRTYSRTKLGLGLNIEQAISASGGLFLRLGWNDGKNETWAFTEIDQTVSAGGLWNGKGWDRPNDHAGGAVVANGLSNDHRDYLAAGGYGFIIGDGKLNYRPETIVEGFYCAQLATWMAATADYQFVLNPAYNADRGPVHVFALRMHLEM